MSLSPGWVAVLLLPLALASTGCVNSCEQLCFESSRYIDGCLEHWEALWPDLGYDGRYDTNDEVSGVAAGDPYQNGPVQEYQERCRARYSAAEYFSGPSALRAIREACAQDLQAVASAGNCSDYLPNDIELDPTEGDNGVAPRPGG